MSTRSNLANWIGALFLGFGALMGQSHAGFLGKTIGAETQFPTQGTVCCGSGNAVVGAGVEFAAGSFPSYNPAAYVDVGDARIEYGQTAGTGYQTATFNGFRFFDVLSTIDAIIGVSIDSATDLAGFDISRVSFDADNVYINMESLSAPGAHRVVLNVLFASNQVPEPDSIALLVLALGLIGFARSRAPRGETAAS